MQIAKLSLLTNVTQDDAGNDRGWPVALHSGGLHPNVIAPIRIQWSQFQIVGSRQNAAFLHLNLKNNESIYKLLFNYERATVTRSDPGPPEGLKVEALITITFLSRPPERGREKATNLILRRRRGKRPQPCLLQGKIKGQNFFFATWFMATSTDLSNKS